MLQTQANPKAHKHGRQSSCLQTTQLLKTLPLVAAIATHCVHVVADTHKLHKKCTAHVQTQASTINSACGTLWIPGLLFGGNLRPPALFPLPATAAATSAILPTTISLRARRRHVHTTRASSRNDACSSVPAAATAAAAGAAAVSPCCCRVAAATAWGVEAEEAALGALLTHQQVLAVELWTKDRRGQPQQGTHTHRTTRRKAGAHRRRSARGASAHA